MDYVGHAVSLIATLNPCALLRSSARTLEASANQKQKWSISVSRHAPLLILRSRRAETVLFHRLEDLGNFVRLSLPILIPVKADYERKGGHLQAEISLFINE